jgi:hypothetical protein
MLKMDKIKQIKIKTDPHKWVRRHFSQLVDKYAGMYAIFANGELFIGKDAKKLDREASIKHPGIIPSGFRIPRSEDFNCAL